MKKNTAIALLILLLIIAAIAIWFGLSVKTPGDKASTENAASGDPSAEGVTVVAEGLHVPWSMAFLPDGGLMVTERDGTLRVIKEGVDDIKIAVPGAVEGGEGGLLGVALHPDFKSNGFVYLYFTARDGDRIINRVVRYAFDGDSIEEDLVIIDDIPGGTNHDGGRIAFGPDGMLYITTGDAGEEALAQDTASLAGKVLRVRDDGSVPADNPFGNAVYSYGHRNPQGLAWDDQGRLWETEHGRSGLRSGLDEINLIEKGANYGWPLIEGDEVSDGMRAPVAHSGPNMTWAPSGIAFRDGKLYFAGLRGRALYDVEVMPDGTLGSVNERLKDQYGRLRGVAVGPDNSLYITTSNQDERGRPVAEDDRVLRLP